MVRKIFRNMTECPAFLVVPPSIFGMETVALSEQPQRRLHALRINSIRRVAGVERERERDREREREEWG